jgi:hypothetical protein
MSEAEFDQTRGNYTGLKKRINSEQSTSARVSRHDDDSLHIIIVNSNDYFEKGNTFRNWLIFKDEDRQPIFVFYNKRGVSSNFNGGSPETTKTDTVDDFEAEDLDRIRFVELKSDNNGGTDRFWKEVRDVVDKGVKEGTVKLISNTISGFSGDLKKFLGATS